MFVPCHPELVSGSSNSINNQGLENQAMFEMLDQVQHDEQYDHLA